MSGTALRIPLALSTFSLKDKVLLVNHHGRVCIEHWIPSERSASVNLLSVGLITKQVTPKFFSPWIRLRSDRLEPWKLSWWVTKRMFFSSYLWQCMEFLRYPKCPYKYQNLCFAKSYKAATDPAHQNLSWSEQESQVNPSDRSRTRLRWLKAYLKQSWFAHQRRDHRVTSSIDKIAVLKGPGLFFKGICCWYPVINHFSWANPKIDSIFSGG